MKWLLLWLKEMYIRYGLVVDGTFSFLHNGKTHLNLMLSKTDIFEMDIYQFKCYFSNSSRGLILVWLRVGIMSAHQHVLPEHAKLRTFFQEGCSWSLVVELKSKHYLSVCELVWVRDYFWLLLNCDDTANQRGTEVICWPRPSIWKTHLTYCIAEHLKP